MVSGVGAVLSTPWMDTIVRLLIQSCIAGLLASVLSGCSLYTEGRLFVEQPLEVLECLPECPSSTEPMTLQHGVTGATVTCGPYPSALYSSMAAVYRQERRQCLARYQQQGYTRLVHR